METKGQRLKKIYQQQSRSVFGDYRDYSPDRYIMKYH